MTLGCESVPVTTPLIRKGENRNQAPGWNYQAGNFQNETLPNPEKQNYCKEEIGYTNSPGTWL